MVGDGFILLTQATGYFPYATRIKLCVEFGQHRRNHALEYWNNVRK